MKNMDIRQAARTAGVFLWQIAEELNITDSTFQENSERNLKQKRKRKFFRLLKIFHRQIKSVSNLDTQRKIQEGGKVETL